jgi:predicted Zn-dependent protease with MMP-like domain
MYDFPEIDRVHEMLDEIAEALPIDFFKELNEGVVLLPQTKYHPKSKNKRPLYIMGEYHRSITGSHIRIYYGSFQRVFNGLSEDRLKKELESTLVHEFTHHLETLAGEKGLVIKDEVDLDRYLND